VLFSSLMFAVDRKKYSNPKLQTALLVGTVIESGWLSRRILKADSYLDRNARLVDTVWSAVGMVLCEAWLGDRDVAPWMKNIAIGSATGAAISESPTERAGLLGVLSAAAVVSGLRAKGRDSEVAGVALAVNDVISWTGQHLAISTYLSAYRRQARLKDEADRKALENTAELTASEERRRQHSLVHRRTAAVLRSIADSDDMQLASAAARLEASRLRQLLRSKGEVPKDLESALYDAAELARTEGLRIELVTAELAHDTNPEVTGSLFEVVHGTLQAARECVSSGRVVIRAISDADSVTVTIRHQFADAGAVAEALYSRRLSALEPALDQVGGRVELWAAKGRGIRVTCVAPARSSSRGHGAGHEPAERFPDGALRSSSAGDHDGSFDQGHLDVRVLAEVVGSPHDDVGVTVFDQSHPRGVGEALEPGSQQWPGGDDQRARRSTTPFVATGNSDDIHPVRMTEPPPRVLVRNIHFEPEIPDDGRDAEQLRVHRALATIFFTWRFGGLATGLSALVAGRRSYRSQPVAGAQLLIATAESAWLARRLRSHGYELDPVTRGVDVATAVTMLAIGRFNLAYEHRRTWLNWAPWSFAAATICMCSSDMESRRRGELGAGTIIGSCTLVADRWSDRLVNSTGMAALFVVGRHFVSLFFSGVDQIVRSRSEAIEEERRLAVDQERFRQMRLLHDSALQTLEAVGSGRYSELSAVRATANEEARKLEREIAGEYSAQGTLQDEIGAIVDLHEKRGLDITVRIDSSANVRADVVGALRDACNESLTNVRKHARSNKASVTVERADGGAKLTVEDQGIGFDPSARTGFGLPQSIKQRMLDVGGTAHIDSAPGTGSRVVLWGPG